MIAPMAADSSPASHGETAARAAVPVGRERDLGRERDARRALERARAVLADPERWTRSHTARKADGRPCRATSKVAARWNMSGALMAVTGRRSGCPGSPLLVEAAGGFRAFVELETRSTHAAILAAFERAIVLAPVTATSAAATEPAQKADGAHHDHVYGG